MWNEFARDSCSKNHPFLVWAHIHSPRLRFSFTKSCQHVKLVDSFDGDSGNIATKCALGFGPVCLAGRTVEKQGLSETLCNH